jgi:hypothetical protein
MPTKSLIESKMESQCPYLSQLKPYDQRETFVEYLTNHYALMAMHPATIEQARLRTKELKVDFPTLGILIAARLKELRNEMPIVPSPD